MTKMANRITIAGVLVSAALAVSCGRQEPGPQPVRQNPAPAGKWQPTMPSSFSGLKVREGGQCYLDVINGASVGAAPTPVKSGSVMSLAGWAVADTQSGQAGSAAGVQLISAGSSYSAPAASYARPGLGAALKGPSSLDSGGLKLDSTTLNVPAGQYSVRFLVQSDGEMVRCDTGRILSIQ